MLRQDILDDMESEFLNAQGTLADKLMAAMQGAKRVGANRRCPSHGVSSLSAFLRVAMTGDSISDYGLLSIDINIGNTPVGIDPIDLLQKVYNTVTVIEVSSIGVPGKFTLSQNTPNPFNPITTINYRLPNSSDVLLTVYDLTGRQGAILVDGRQPAGEHSVRWSGTDSFGEEVSSGIYLYRLQAGEYFESRKMLLIK